jgi:hypothetical protein
LASPSRPPYRPGRHATHAAMPACWVRLLYRPTVQLEQNAALALEYVPTPHGSLRGPLAGGQ